MIPFHSRLCIAGEAKLYSQGLPQARLDSKEGAALGFDSATREKACFARAQMTHFGRIITGMAHPIHLGWRYCTS